MDAVMQDFIHRQNLALFKKQLAQTQDDAQRKVIAKLLADEQAKEPLPKNKT